MSHRSLSNLVSAVLAASFLVRCTDRSPSQASPLSTPQATTGDPTAPSSSQPDIEPLTCDQLESVNVRFSDPGYVDGNRVGMYASFEGAPPGDKFLKIWWDYVNEPQKTEIVDTQAGEPRRDNDDIFDIYALVEHEYDFTQNTEVTVRVELILEDTTRGCARNRSAVVGSGGPTLITRVVTGTSPPNPATISFRPVDTSNVESTVVTVRLSALGSSTSAQMQVGLLKNGACCPWRAPFVIFPADGASHTFRFGADVDFTPDGIAIGFRGVTSAEFRVEVSFTVKE